MKAKKILCSLYLLFLLFLFVSCGGGNSAPENLLHQDQDDTFPDDVKKIDFNASLSDLIIENDPNQEIFLTINGSSNTITIKEQCILNSFILDGSLNKVFFEKNVIVHHFEILGSLNEISIPLDSGIYFTTTGSGNILIEY